MKKTLTGFVAAAMLTLAATAAVAQDALPYKEGVVVVVTAIRTEPGQFNNYMRYLAGDYRKIMDEAKAQGLIVSYAHYAAQPKGPHDADLYTTIAYPNFAAFDGLTDKMAAISSKVFGSMSGAEKAQVDRESLRKVLGSEVIQKLDMK